MTSKTRNHGIVTDKSGFRHLVEQLACLLEMTGCCIRRNDCVVGAWVFLGEFAEGFVGGLDGVAFGIDVYEAVGEVGIENEGGFDEVRVEEFA